METTVSIFIAGDTASDKTQIVQILSDALKAKGIAFIANDAGDCFGNNGTNNATIKGVVTIATLLAPVK